ncbi:M20 aminoacylase family protein [Falsirhodobacter sp. 20TX0035]|uniref:M20 aminoacylase family protein n=1 Tax=Falsirhodobacter sp. 20TX0035 TaxID=3022019 RepID=UPI002330389F|nr:M20 aminoacylase family protein [Falsirhodobacter sp. 20TX0035]MDB6454057.1 M20 family metallopeptidase [Falsirhodobacter sp. 20TX0035]
MTSRSDILKVVDTYMDELVAIRHDIHAHPELGFEEVRTAALVAEKLRGWGIEVHEGVGRTGVVGTLRGNLPGNRSIGLRADLDALPLTEKTGLPYASTIPGKMHACGHDGHTTMLLGAARYLSEHRDFAGTVHFIFQPAEEGLGGGREMLADGLFERFPVDAVYGMHNEAGRPVGDFATAPGPYMAAGDTWQVTFVGTGGHGGAAPHLATDPTVPAAHFVLGVQSIIGRNIAAVDSAVISVGHLAAGAPGAPNIIPDTVFVKGTARSYRPEIRDLVERRLAELAHAHAAAYGCTAEPVYIRRYPPLINDPAATDRAVAAAAQVVGEGRVDGNGPRHTGSEDFSFMLEARPGAMIMIGIGEDAPFVHTPHYDFNDRIIPTGVAYWVSLVI